MSARFVRGKLVEYCGEFTALHGAKVRMVRSSPATQGITVEFVESKAGTAYRAGAQINVARHELRDIQQGGAPNGTP